VLLRLAFLACALSVGCVPSEAQPTPLFEVLTREVRTSGGISVQFTLINHSGRRLKGCQVMAEEISGLFGTQMAGGVTVQDFPAGTKTEAERVALPGSAGFSSTDPDFQPKIRARVIFVRFADGTEWRNAMETVPTTR